MAGTGVAAGPCAMAHGAAATAGKAAAAFKKSRRESLCASFIRSPLKIAKSQKEKQCSGQAQVYEANHRRVIQHGAFGREVYSPVVVQLQAAASAGRVELPVNLNRYPCQFGLVGIGRGGETKRLIDPVKKIHPTFSRNAESGKRFPGFFPMGSFEPCQPIR